MKRIGVVSVIIAAMLLCSCGEKPESEIATVAPTPTAVDEETLEEEPQEDAIYLPVETEPPVVVTKANARLRTANSEVYTDVYLEKGATVPVPCLQGYTFTGYQDAQTDGVPYIDAEGTVIRDYYGVDLLVLWPQFEANEYELTFYENGNELKQISKIHPVYANNIYQDLKFGRVIPKTTGNREEEDRIVIGFLDADGKEIISYDMPKITVRSFANCVDYDARTVAANVETTPIYYKNHITNNAEFTCKINNDGFFKQSVTKDGKNYHEFDLGEQVNLEALRAMGYKTAKIHLECVLVAKDGVPHIRLLNCNPSDEKMTDDMILLDSEKNKDADKGETIKDKKTGNQETFKQNISVSLDRLKGNVYVFYNTESPAVVGGLLQDGWTLQVTRLEIEFTK